MEAMVKCCQTGPKLVIHTHNTHKLNISFLVLVTDELLVRVD